MRRFEIEDVTTASCWVTNCDKDNDYNPFLLIDGDPSTFFSSNEMFSKDLQGPLWIQLELQNVEIVSEVRITNRDDDCCADRLSNVEIKIVMSKLLESDTIIDKEKLKIKSF